MIFLRCYQNSKWPQEVNSKIFGVLLKFKMAATDQLQFFVGAKTLNLKVRSYSHFTITFPTIWRYAGNFFRVLLVLLKFRMAATNQLQFFCGFNITFLATWGPFSTHRCRSGQPRSLSVTTRHVSTKTAHFEQFC